MSRTSRIPPIDSIDVAKTLPQSVHHFHGEVLSRVKVVSTEAEYQTAMEEHAKVFGTHSGKFHTDEALGLAIRCMMEPVTSLPIIIVRSRKPEMLAHCTELFDVGHRYDPVAGFFDHHQQDFETYFGEANENKTVMATAGLVYKEWGERLITLLYPNIAQNSGLLEEMFQDMYTNFVEAVDAVDNGFSVMPLGARPRYRVTTTIQGQVNNLNQSLLEKDGGAGNDYVTQNERFIYAMLVTMRPFLIMLDKRVQNIKLAAPIVSTALLRCMTRRDRILILPSPCPWKKMLHRLEQDGDIDDSEKPLLCVAPSDGPAYMLMTISIDVNNYYLGSRLKLPEEWAGKQKEELDEVTGLEGCIFCHRGRFIAGNKTLEGTVAMAKAAIDTDSRSKVRDIFQAVRAEESHEHEVIQEAKKQGKETAQEKRIRIDPANNETLGERGPETYYSNAVALVNATERLTRQL